MKRIEAELDAALVALIDDEERLLHRVQRQMAKHVVAPGPRTNFDHELIALRDQLGEEHAEDHAALVEHMTRLAALRAAAGRSRTLPADPACPYFAHLRLREADRTQDILIGRRAFIDSRAGVNIVDWRNSPISRVFYRYEEGDEYEETFAGKPRRGRVEIRRTLTITEGRLRGIRTREHAVARAENDQWHRLGQGGGARLAGGTGTALRPPPERFGRAGPDHRLPEITALIDPRQFEAITGERSGVVVITGGAGTGKTTIALHRAAWLHFQDPRRYSGRSMLFITPGEGLARYVERVLPTLDVPNVPIRTFHRWAHEAVKRLIPALRKRKLTDETPPGARRVKRHAALPRLLWEVVREEARGWDPAFEAAGGKPLLDAWVARRTLAPVPRLRALRKWLDGPGEGALSGRTTRARRAVEQALAELSDPVETWAALLTDRDRLGAAFESAGDPVYNWMLDQTVEIVSRQADEPEDYRHLDADRRVGIDGRGLDEGEITGRLDADDLAILLRLCQLKYGALTGPSGQSITYEHIAVDEAQDLSPLTLKVLIDTVKRGGPVTLAGDTAQRVSFDNGFDDWGRLLDTLRVTATVLPPLAVSYRSTRQVMALARAVLGPLAPDIVARDARDGAPVEVMRLHEMGAAVAFLADALRSLHDRERRATVALVARTPEVADAYYDGLRQAEVPRLRRVRAQDFEFTAGIDVTDVFQIKGLEYDYVVLLEATADQYPDTVESRHLLHVGATRAAHQLWLLASSTPTPLLPTWVLSGADPAAAP